MISILSALGPKQVLKDKAGTFIASDNMYWLNFESTDNGIAQFYQLLEYLKRNWNIKDDVYVNIITALSEAVINAMVHGNKREENKSVYIYAYRVEEEYIFTIEDDGEGFGCHRIENPTDMQNRAKPGGRGVFIMAYLADTIRFTEGGTCVEMIFRNKRCF